MGENYDDAPYIATPYGDALYSDTRNDEDFVIKDSSGDKLFDSYDDFDANPNDDPEIMFSTIHTSAHSAATTSAAVSSSSAEERPIVIPPCFFTCSATAKNSLVAMRDSGKIGRKWDAVSPPTSPSEILVGETLALIIVCVVGLALNFCAFYMGRKNQLKKNRIYMKVIVHMLLHHLKYHKIRVLCSA